MTAKLLLALSLASLIPAPARARSYAFHEVARVSTDLISFLDAVAINDEGEVAWAWGNSNDSADVFKAMPGAPRTTIQTGVVGFAPRIYIDDQGRVGYEDDGELRRGEGFGPERLWNSMEEFGGQLIVGGGFSAIGTQFPDSGPTDPWRMNRAGTFVFFATFVFDPPVPPYDIDNIYYGPGNSTAFASTTPATEGGANFPYTDYPAYAVQSLAIGTDGSVVFSENDQTCTPACHYYTYLVRMDGPNVVVPIVAPPDRFSAGVVLVEDVNGHGDVLFSGYDEIALDGGLFLSRGGSDVPDDPTLVVGVAAGAYSRIWNGSLGDDRSVAFLATVPPDPVQAPSGIFAGPDPLADRVIANGDALLGGVVGGPFLLGGINASGQIAFAASLEVGPDQADYIVVRADPVPEPGNEEAEEMALASLFGVALTRTRSPGVRSIAGVWLFARRLV